jgi:hypothetical protein
MPSRLEESILLATPARPDPQRSLLCGIQQRTAIPMQRLGVPSKRFETPIVDCTFLPSGLSCNSSSGRSLPHCATQLLIRISTPSPSVPLIRPQSLPVQDARSSTLSSLWREHWLASGVHVDPTCATNRAPEVSCAPHGKDIYASSCSILAASAGQLTPRT